VPFLQETRGVGYRAGKVIHPVLGWTSLFAKNEDRGERQIVIERTDGFITNRSISIHNTDVCHDSLDFFRAAKAERLWYLSS